MGNTQGNTEPSAVIAEECALHMSGARASAKPKTLLFSHQTDSTELHYCLNVVRRFGSDGIRSDICERHDVLTYRHKTCIMYRAVIVLLFARYI